MNKTNFGFVTTSLYFSFKIFYILYILIFWTFENFSRKSCKLVRIAREMVREILHFSQRFGLWRATEAWSRLNFRRMDTPTLTSLDQPDQLWKMGHKIARCKKVDLKGDKRTRGQDDGGLIQFIKTCKMKNCVENNKMNKTK